MTKNCNFTSKKTIKWREMFNGKNSLKIYNYEKKEIYKKLYRKNTVFFKGEFLRGLKVSPPTIKE